MAFASGWKRRAPVLGAMVGAAVAIAACGGDGDEAKTLSIDASGSRAKPTLKAPATAEAGLTEITLTNDSPGPVDAQLLRVEGNHSPQQVVQEGLSAAISGKPFPSWFFAGGGVGSIGPDESATAQEVLQPGTYYVVNTEADGRPDVKSLPAIKVTGEESDAELPGTDATVTAIDYGFETEGELKVGENEITFANTGGQPHHIIATQLVKGATAKQAEQFLKTEKGKPPFAGGPDDSPTTAVVEGGESQVITLDLPKPGKYALYCFITDRQGGPPHVFKGMVDEAEVSG